jgi:glycine hydroxymethyltransferase
MFSKKNTLATVDPEVFASVTAENRRQEHHIELIASENYVSLAMWTVSR